MCGGWVDLISKKKFIRFINIGIINWGGGVIFINNFDFIVNFLIFILMFYIMVCFKKVYLM